MPDTTVARPIEQLRDNAKRLEAALSVGLADPAAKAVHELRSCTRRVEAQLMLLSMVHGLPAYKPIAEKLLRRLAVLRRKAGRVRDCDVQTKLLKDEDRAIASAVEAPAGLSKAQEKLTTKLSKARQREEKKLVAEVKRQLPKVARDTEKLLKALKPAAHHTTPVAEILRAIEHQMERLLSSPEHGEEHLHDLRKAAKRARYQCESLPGAQAAAMAKRLENLQDAGGNWHDLLDLATTCHQQFGAEQPLSRVLEHLRDQRLDAYLANLEKFREQHTDRPAATSQRKPPQRAAAARSRGSSASVRGMRK